MAALKNQLRSRLLGLAPLSFALLSTLSLGGCDAGETSYASGSGAHTLTVHRASFQSSIRLSGVLRAAESASILSPQGAWGVSIRWMAEDGAVIEKGEKVLEIDNSSVISQLDAHQVELIKARGDLVQQKNTAIINLAEKAHALEQADITLRKARLDAEVPKDAYPRRVWEDMQLALQRAMSEQQAASRALETEQKVQRYDQEQKELALSKAERNIEAVLAQLEDFVLHAPRAGILVVGESWQEGRPYRTGDKIWPGQVISQIPDLSVMTIEAELSDVDDGRIHVGMKANCILDAYPELHFPARVASISPVAQPPQRRSLRRAFDVLLELEQTDQERMRPGMSVQVQVLDAVKENALLIPRAALRFEEHAVFALLANGEDKAVTLGPCSARECVLEGGLAENSSLRGRQ